MFILSQSIIYQREILPVCWLFQSVCLLPIEVLD